MSPVASLTLSATSSAVFLTLSQAVLGVDPPTFSWGFKGSWACLSAWTVSSEAEGFERCSMSLLPGCCAVGSEPEKRAGVLVMKRAAGGRLGETGEGLAEGI